MSHKTKQTIPDLCYHILRMFNNGSGNNWACKKCGMFEHEIGKNPYRIETTEERNADLFGTTE